jgi:hypothetical protein
MSFVYLHNITIRVSAIISVTDVVYEELNEEDIEAGVIKNGIFTVTLTNGYPITFRGPFGEIENEHEKFLKTVKCVG